MSDFPERFRKTMEPIGEEMQRQRNTPGYAWGFHGTDASYAHIALDGDDLFDVSIYPGKTPDDPGVTGEERGWYAASLGALDQIVRHANIGRALTASNALDLATAIREVSGVGEGEGIDRDRVVELACDLAWILSEVGQGMADDDGSGLTRAEVVDMMRQADGSGADFMMAIASHLGIEDEEVEDA